MFADTLYFEAAAGKLPGKRVSVNAPDLKLVGHDLRVLNRSPLAIIANDHIGDNGVAMELWVHVA